MWLGEDYTVSQGQLRLLMACMSSVRKRGVQGDPEVSSLSNDLAMLVMPVGYPSGEVQGASAAIRLGFRGEVRAQIKI